MKEKFLNKHNLTELDYRNLKRFEQVRQSGIMNMYEYLGLMSKSNVNGGSKLASWIQKGDNYGEFLEVLAEELE